MISAPLLMILMMSASPIAAAGIGNAALQEAIEEESVPKYLYKIISVENWQQSQHQTYLRLSDDDAAFIHFSKEEQLSRICQKYWSHVPVYIVLKIETSNLIGNLVLEENQPGGAKYYHIYEGAIPLRSVVEYTIIQN